jgi:fumarate reductase flavoprotein subunit
MSSGGMAKTGKLKAELVIIGGGGTGLAAAVAAKENGAGRVILLEKRGMLGGNTSMSMGPFAVDSPAQKRAAIEFRRDEVFKIVMNWAHWKINPRIVRAFIDKSGDTIRWLEDKGLEFKCMPLYPNQSPLTWHMPKGYGAEIVRVLAKECRKLGVEVLTRTPARKILLGPNGEVTGVLAEREGKESTITTTGVIIGTGGYSGNKELLKKYCPDYHDNMKCDGVLHTGDGLLMAMEIGAATEGLGLLLLSGPQIPQAVAMKIGSYASADGVPEPLMAIALEPNTVWVNKKGKRFIDEGTSYHHFESSNAVNRQPGNLCYTLLDSSLVQTMSDEGLIIGLGRHTVEERTKMPGLAKELQLLADKGWVKMADSWDDIAGWIGADPEVLRATIDEYNAACDRGHDPIFAKDQALLVPLRTPPYYAIRSNSDFLDTIGGIKINERMEVLDKQDNPIPGLYAGGVTTGGWQADTYCDILSGTTSGFALSSGRIAAENAVRYVRGDGK